MKKWGVLGWGKSGQAVAKYLEKKNEGVIGIDDFSSCCVKDVDLSEIHTLVVSPGIKMGHPLLQKAKHKICITSEMEMGLSLCKDKKIPLVAVTGSVGKTTTSLLLTHFLQRGGKKAHCLGNVGTPILSFFLEEQAADLLVIEISSFQIEKMKPQELFDQVVILNLYPNHLDYHKSYEEYKNTKLSLANFLKPEGELMVSEEIALSVEGMRKRVCIYEKERVAIDLVKGYRGNIFLENIQVAGVVAKRWGVLSTQADIDCFAMPGHRLEDLGEIKGVSFVNDSKATSVMATLGAVKSMTKRVILLAGGIDKAADFTPWLTMFREKVKMLVVMGEAKEKLSDMCKEILPVVHATCMQEAVKFAFAKAERGDCILLSPGCASYDQYANYEERGESFKQAVLELQGVI